MISQQLFKLASPFVVLFTCVAINTESSSTMLEVGGPTEVAGSKLLAVGC